jgi:uncharacterized membrane protein YeaQ/YmgE (transglycosylase-associated protein family)
MDAEGGGTDEYARRSAAPGASTAQHRAVPHHHNGGTPRQQFSVRWGAGILPRSRGYVSSKGAFEMGILAWIVLGLVAGFLASRVVNKQGVGMSMDIVLGIVGAVVGGFLAHLAGFTGITGLNLYSILIAFGGAVVVLFAYHALARPTA